MTSIVFESYLLEAKAFERRGPSTLSSADGRVSPSCTKFKLELMELENIVANTVYLKAREGESDEMF